MPGNNVFERQSAFSARVGRTSSARCGDRGNPFSYRRVRHSTTSSNVVSYGATSIKPALSIPSQRPRPVAVGCTFGPPPKPVAHTDPAAVGAVKVTSVDLQIANNTQQHFTDKFEVTHRYVDGVLNEPSLVVRRGQHFDITLTLSATFDPKFHDFKLVFEIGEVPRESKKSRVRIIVSDDDKPKQWGAKVLAHSGKDVKMRVYTPPTCIVGKWKLAVESLHQSDEEDPVVYRFDEKIQIYILFNPWCRDDQVYLGDEKKRNEYVLNDAGKIYSGNYKKIGSKPWNFGQFESFILDCALYLLEASGMSYPARANPITVTRRLSAIINSCDDDGVLTGNWSGSYDDGTSPTAWVGSVAILEEFWETRKPVKFGQCWVFSGVTTTICRALGIPVRSVTNFASAHDTDGSITIDIHFDAEGEPLDHLNSDSVWNFHVWNDVWMARPDLPAGCGGWQAIDATPQETSEGVYCAGPASVAAIRNGLTTLPYDTGFLFGEVNADRVYWIVDQVGSYTKVKMDQLSVGRSICAKTATGQVPTGSLYYFGRTRDPDQDDVTKDYKFKEGTDEERVAVRKACEGACIEREVYETPDDDVTFELIDEEEIKLGESFDVILKVTNKSDTSREVHATLSASVMYYTGVPVGIVRKEKIAHTLKAEEVREVKMHVTCDDYVDMLKEQCCMKMSVLARVPETKQYYAAQDDFRLVRPDLSITPSKTQVERGEEFDMHITLINPLNRTLTGCELQIEGPGLLRPLRLPHKAVTPRGTLEHKVTLTPRLSGQTGQRMVMVSFDSKQLKDISGFCNINVA